MSVLSVEGMNPDTALGETLIRRVFSRALDLLMFSRPRNGRSASALISMMRWPRKFIRP